MTVAVHADSADSGGGAGSTKKKLQDATHDELMSLVKHHSSRLKIVEEEYSKLKQKVCAGLEFGTRRGGTRASLLFASVQLRFLAR